MVVLCETNVLSLISQRLDNYYQIQANATVIYRASDGVNFGQLNAALLFDKAGRVSSQLSWSLEEEIQRTMHTHHDHKYASSIYLQKISRSCELLPLSPEGCNYGMRVSLSASQLIKFLVNSIHIYGTKSIYYENTFCN